MSTIHPICKAYKKCLQCIHHKHQVLCCNHRHSLTNRFINTLMSIQILCYTISCISIYVYRIQSMKLKKNCVVTKSQLGGRIVFTLILKKMFGKKMSENVAMQLKAHHSFIFVSFIYLKETHFVVNFYIWYNSNGMQWIKLAWFLYKMLSQILCLH